MKYLNLSTYDGPWVVTRHTLQRTSEGYLGIWLHYKCSVCGSEFSQLKAYNRKRKTRNVACHICTKEKFGEDR